MDPAIEPGIRGLETQQIAVGSGLPPGEQFLVGPFAEAERDGQTGLGLDAADDVAQPLGLEPVVLAGLEHDGAVTELERIVGTGEDLVGGHAVAFELAIGGAQAAVAAPTDAVVGDLDETAKMHRVADVARGVSSAYATVLRDARIGLPQPAFDFVASEGTPSGIGSRRSAECLPPQVGRGPGVGR